MSKLLSINELNSYSRLVYDNKKSTLDAAFELLLKSYYSEKITSDVFKNQTANFILYIYTIVYLQLLNDCDDNMLYLSGNNNDFKLFAYNIIYFYDNQYNDDYYNEIDEQQETICLNDIFYYIISQYLSNCDTDYNDINGYKTTITGFINDNYDYDELIELNDTQQVDWEIYIYVICYNYICLYQDINNDDFIPKYLSNIKHYLNSCIIVYCMNIIINETPGNPDINNFLNEPENKYFSDIINSVQAIFYTNNNIRFQITNCPSLFGEEKILETIFDYVIDYYTYGPAIITNQETGNSRIDKPITEMIIKKFQMYQYYLCRKLGIEESNFNRTILEIKGIIMPNNRGSLKKFYSEFLNKITINSDKIDLIKKEENIYLLNKKFEECFYSLIVRYHDKENDDGYINKIIINLCDDINNINLNYKLNKKIKGINKGLALDNYFFNNFNIHFKLQQLENYQNSDMDETEYCDAFYFPESLSLQDIDYVNLTENITMGLFNLSEKNSPPIKLETTVLFDTFDAYCEMNYILEQNPIEFER